MFLVFFVSDMRINVKQCAGQWQANYRGFPTNSLSVVYPLVFPPDVPSVLPIAVKDIGAYRLDPEVFGFRPIGCITETACGLVAENGRLILCAMGLPSSQ